MSYLRGVSQPAGSRSSYSSSSGSTSRYLPSTSSMSRPIATSNNHYTSSSSAYGSSSSNNNNNAASSSSFGSSSRNNNNNSYGMGESAYSSGPQFDHGHDINRGNHIPTSHLTGNAYGSRASVDDYKDSLYSAATKRVLQSAQESSNQSRFNVGSSSSAGGYNHSSLLPPSRSGGSTGTTSSSSAVDRNPLQFSSSVYKDDILSPSSSSQGASSPSSSSYTQSPYYHERMGAHSHQQPLSNSRTTANNRASSSAISSTRRSTNDYASGFGTTSAAYGASVNNSTPASNRYAPTHTERKAIRDQQMNDSDDDGPHISLAMKNSSRNQDSGVYTSSSGGGGGRSTPSATSPKISSSSSSNRYGSNNDRQPPVGLRNIGNTCYMASSLQCIIHSSGDFFPSLPGALNGNASGKSKLTKALFGLSKASNITDLMTVKSGAATLNHEFTGGRQNDGHEFLREFLHALHIELNRVGKAPYQEMKDIEGESDRDASRRWFNYFRSHDDSIVTDYFGGFMRSTTVCGSCNHRSLSFSPVWDLSLSMSSTGSSGSNIPTMLKDYMKVETLSGSEGSFSCAKCKKKRAGKRQSMLVNWPKVLVIHLCRFTYSGARNSQAVDFPMRLEPGVLPVPSTGSSSTTGDPINGYSLSGIVLHRGTASFGHYTAFVRQSGSRTWYLCDDSSIHTVSENEVLRHRTEAYVLFYTMDD